MISAMVKAYSHMPKSGSKSQKQKAERKLKGEKVVCKKCGVGSQPLRVKINKNGEKEYFCEKHFKGE